MTSWNPAARTLGRRAILLAGGLILALLANAALQPPGARGEPQAPQNPSGIHQYRMPAVTVLQFLDQVSDSLRAMADRVAPQAADRGALFQGVRELLQIGDRHRDRVAQIYPRNQWEWLLASDFADDTLAVVAKPLLDRYRERNPDEILTEGRQLLELELARIVGPPDRMLGLHFALLANLLYAKADTILAAGMTSDRVGLEDGVLRALQDWGQLYAQAHADVIARHTSHLRHEDWILVRLEDNCGHRGPDVWQLGQMYMAVVGRDSSFTPPLEQFAHELHLKARKCEGDERVVYYDLPLLQFTLMEVQKRSEEVDPGLQEELRRLQQEPPVR